MTINSRILVHNDNHKFTKTLSNRHNLLGEIYNEINFLCTKSPNKGEKILRTQYLQGFSIECLKISIYKYKCRLKSVQVFE